MDEGATSRRVEAEGADEELPLAEVNMAVA